MADATKVEVVKTENQHGKIYWFFRHTRDKIKGFARKHIISFIIMVIVALIAMFLLRVFFHPLAIGLRQHLGILIVGLPMLAMMWIMVRKGSIKKRIVIWSLYLILGVLTYYYGRDCYDYFAFYYRYNTLVTVDLDELPISGHE